jgi:hypothetical protein
MAEGAKQPRSVEVAFSTAQLDDAGITDDIDDYALADIIDSFMLSVGDELRDEVQSWLDDHADG